MTFFKNRFCKLYARKTAMGITEKQGSDNIVFLNLTAKTKGDLVQSLEREMMNTAKASQGKDPVHRMIDVIKNSKGMKVSKAVEQAKAPMLSLSLDNIKSRNQGSV